MNTRSPSAHTAFLLCVLLFALLLAIPAAVAASWTNSFNRPGDGTDIARSMAVDSSGNVIVTGLSYTTNYAEFVTVKYSNSGGPLWTNYYKDVAGGGQPTALAVAGNGNVFVTGPYWTGSGMDYDFATIAYSSTGTPLWTNRYTGPLSGGDDEPLAMAANTNGDVFVTGYVQSASNPDKFEFATLKLSGTTGSVLWSRRYAGGLSSYYQAKALAVDTNGHVIVTGSTFAANFSAYSLTTIKYAGTNGLPLWTNIYTSPYPNGSPRAIVADRNADVIMTGYVPTYAIGSGHWDYFTIKYSGATGQSLWTRTYNGTGFMGSDGEDRASAVAVGTNGHVYVTGASTGSGTGLDYATLAYAGTNGLPLWTNRYNGPGNGGDQALAVVAPAGGAVIVTGGSLGSGSTNDFATIAYAATNGAPLWTNRYNGPANGDDIAVGLATDTEGNVFVAGLSLGASGTPDYLTIKYAVTDAPVLTRPTLTIAWSGGNRLLTWPTNAGDFTLQQNPDLHPTNWTTCGATVTVTGTNHTAPVTNTADQSFFRLVSP